MVGRAGRGILEVGAGDDCRTKWTKAPTMTIRFNNRDAPCHRPKLFAASAFWVAVVLLAYLTKCQRAILGSSQKPLSATMP